MSLTENLKAKKRLDALARQLDSQIRTTPGQTKIDKNALRKLLEFAGFAHDRVRDNELYTRPLEGAKKEIVVVDNEVPVYHTTVRDVGLRKSPHWKEVFSVPNVIKILNDKDVVVSRRKDSLHRIYGHAFSQLDFSYTDEEIQKLVSDGEWGLEDNQPELVEETLGYFVEILGYRELRSDEIPSSVRMFGRPKGGDTPATQYEDIILCDRGKLRLVCIQGVFAPDDEEDIRRLLDGFRGRKPVDAKGEGVFAFLGDLARAVDPQERPHSVRGLFPVRPQEMHTLQ